MTYKYASFIYEGYHFDEHSKELKLNYSFQNGPSFTESYKFDFEFAEYDQNALSYALEILNLIAGVSYFKAYLAEQLVVNQSKVDDILSSFLSSTYQKGLGEFLYINKLDPSTQFEFKVNSGEQPAILVNNKGLLIGVGGGKDSLVAIEAVKKTGIEFATWSLGHKNQLQPLVKRIGSKHLWVSRNIDPQIIEINNQQDSFNGHIPISAIFAAVGTVVAILAGYRDVVVSNEASADEPTLEYKGHKINHQYSKSSEFESGFQQLLKSRFGESIRYYSLLRPFSELYISEKFCRESFDKYRDVFSSCNKAFRQNSDKLFWDGTCPKCAFIFLAFSPFIERGKLESLFEGKNLLLDEKLSETYKNLLGIEGEKPLECVGEIKESRSAMDLAKQQYGELEKYSYDIPSNYDYRQKRSHQIPADIYEEVSSYLD